MTRIPITTKLREDEYNDLRALANEYGVSMNRILILAVRSYMLSMGTVAPDNVKFVPHKLQ
jgi:ABC-type uncharacterized transport system involved in gliding motility auxiliary subunit